MPKNKKSGGKGRKISADKMYRDMHGVVPGGKKSKDKKSKTKY